MTLKQLISVGNRRLSNSEHPAKLQPRASFIQDRREEGPTAPKAMKVAIRTCRHVRRSPGLPLRSASIRPQFLHDKTPNIRLASTLSPAWFKLGQPVHETHPHLLKAGERTSINQLKHDSSSSGSLGLNLQGYQHLTRHEMDKQ